MTKLSSEDTNHLTIAIAAVAMHGMMSSSLVSAMSTPKAITDTSFDVATRFMARAKELGLLK